MTYLPLYAERRCIICGSWRGLHIGCSADDAEMHCPVDPAIVAWAGVKATFVPEPR